MTDQAKRGQTSHLVDEAVRSGARRWRACQEAGVSVRTVQRWNQGGQIRADRRPEVNRSSPTNKLTPTECDAIIAISNRAEFASAPPSQIVPRLAR